MSRISKSLLTLLGASFFIIGGCGDDSSAPTAPEGTNVVVTGEVVEVQNAIPSDGGITLTVTPEVGGTEQLLFPSLFTLPPPSEETFRLYDVVKRVEVGNVVRAVGIRTTAGIALESLVILPAGM